jgi:type I restriction-modification system DNA methylase subunit
MMQENTEEIFRNLNNIASRSDLILSDLFDIFLDIVFIKAVYTLNLENNLNTSNKWGKILSSSNPKYYVLFNVLPSLIESDDKNIKFYFDSSSPMMENVEESTFNNLLEMVNDIQLEQLSPYQRYEYIENILDFGMIHFRRGEYLSFRTPKPLRNFLTKILDPESHDKIASLACGTGALLLSAHAHIFQNIEMIPNNIFYGVDISKQMLRIAILHSYIAGMKSLFVERRDIIKDFISPDNIASYDKVYATPPFNIRVRPDEVNENFTIQTRQADILFLESTMALLSENGMAAAVVVGNVLSGLSPAHIDIRKKLIEEMHVEAVINVSVKLAFTHIPIYIIIFKKEIRQADILFLDLTSGLRNREADSVINKRLEEGISLYRNYIEAGYTLDTNHDDNVCWTASKDVIRENSYSLDMNRYKPMNEVTVPQIDNLLSGLREQHLKILNDIDELNKSIHTIQKLSTLDFTEKMLGDICEMRSGRPLPRNVEIENGDLPWIQIRDITKSKGFVLTEAEESVSEEFAQNNRLTIIEKDDLLISVRGTIGTMAIAGKKMCIGPNIIAMSVRESHVNSWFLFGWLLQERARFENLAQGTIPMITIGQLRNTTVQVPTLENQEHFLKYYEAMKKAEYIKQLSESNNALISQMANALFNTYFKPKE